MRTLKCKCDMEVGPDEEKKRTGWRWRSFVWVVRHKLCPFTIPYRQVNHFFSFQEIEQKCF